MKNLCETLVEDSEGPTLTLDCLPGEMRHVARCLEDAPARGNGDEIALIRRILEETGNNVSETARRLGISRTTVYKKVIWTPTDID